MPASALALVLAAVGLHAGWNLLLHGSEDRTAVMAVSSLLGGLALAPWLALRPPGRVVGLFLLAGVAQAAYGAFLSAAYARGALSLVYPVARGTAPLVVTLVGMAVLAETPAAPAAAGAACLAAGLGFLGLAGRRRVAGPAVLLGLATGLCIAAYSVVDARAVRTVNPLGYLSAELLVAGVVLAAGCRWAGSLRSGSRWAGAAGGDAGSGGPGSPTPRPAVTRLRRALPAGALVAAGSTGAYLLVLLAFQRAAAGRVATLRELSVVVGIAASRERPGRVVWAGALLVVGGAVLAGL